MSENELKVGAVCHIEIPAPDLGKAKSFYSSLFQWEVTEIPEMNYGMFNAANISGGFSPNMEPATEGIGLFLKVDDIPGKLEEIKEAGGAVVAEKTLISDEFGFYATFTDPNGNQMGLWSKN